VKIGTLGYYNCWFSDIGVHVGCVMLGVGCWTQKVVPTQKLL
jgi:hypothetical protein